MRPISLLNVNIRILFKGIAKKPKEVLPCLISAQQTAYVQNRNIGESGRLIQCSWIKRLYNVRFHVWKIIPLHLISKNFGKSYIFLSNLSFKKN